ncbi:hypothetical protein MAPG_00970 [Magnaporthiopsis poae ATCC 64411]|uniref:Uncharacterized protein n=1 Tax=Magnaporthiopsis poae (strain ATCC 64411 / 73-15) TaxID=644358 RepID=A0A0C4DMG3_MAGP6|nr:hypothetical protein MAPG_00970 [Magnaporthiopsis poae ATCC 64411]
MEQRPGQAINPPYSNSRVTLFLFLLAYYCSPLSHYRRPPTANARTLPARELPSLLGWGRQGGRPTLTTHTHTHTHQLSLTCGPRPSAARRLCMYTFNVALRRLPLRAH